MGLLPVVIVIVVVLVFAIVLSLAFSAKRGEIAGGGKKRIRAKDKAQILKEANRRLASNPKDLEALGALGSLAWDEQDWERACKTYETLTEAGAGNPDIDEFEANARYGIAALKLGRMEDAYRGLMVAPSSRTILTSTITLACSSTRRRPTRRR
jgi:hypothetical protein